MASRVGAMAVLTRSKVLSDFDDWTLAVVEVKNKIGRYCNWRLIYSDEMAIAQGSHNSCKRETCGDQPPGLPV